MTNEAPDQESQPEFVPEGWLTLPSALVRAGGDGEAWNRLRQWLFGGRVQARVLTENGRTYKVPNNVWATPFAKEALSSGKGRVHDGSLVGGYYVEGWVLILGADVESVLAYERVGQSPLTHSAMPGRPTARHLYLVELERRFKNGSLCTGVAAESRALYDWLKATHPDINRGTPKTIENNIRAPYRRLTQGPPPK